MMIRVIDVKKALSLFSTPILYKGSFTVKSDNRWAPWNSKVLGKVSLGEGTVTVEDLDEPPFGDPECDLQAFSQVISGYIGMKEVKDLGRVTAHNQDILGGLGG